MHMQNIVYKGDDFVTVSPKTMSIGADSSTKTVAISQDASIRITEAINNKKDVQFDDESDVFSFVL